MKTLKLICLATLSLLASPLYAVVDDAHSKAMEAAVPAVKDGFFVREEYWAGSLAPGKTSTVKHQLYKGNTYWFWLASDDDSAVVSVHVYDGGGNLVDTASTQKGNMATVQAKPTASGVFYVVFKVEKAKAKKVRWALAYGFK